MLFRSETRSLPNCAADLHHPIEQGEAMKLGLVALALAALPIAAAQAQNWPARPVTLVAPSFSLRGGTREILRGMIARGLGLR